MQKQGEIKSTYPENLFLNKTQENVLQELILNSRIPIATLAKKLNSTPITISKYIDDLQKKEIILQYLTVVNFLKSGYSMYYIFIKTPHNEKNILIEELRKNPYSIAIFKIEENYNILSAFAFKEDDEINIILDLLSKYKIMDYQYYKVIKMSFEPYILFTQNQKKFKSINYEVTKLNKDETLILSQIKYNSRKSIVDIAKDIHLSPELTLYKFNNLKKKGIIECFFTNINIYKLGFLPYILRLKVKNSLKEKIFEYIKKYPNTNGQYMLKSSWNILTFIIFRNAYEMELFIERIHEKYGNEIIKYEFSQLKSQEFNNLFPNVLI